MMAINILQRTCLRPNYSLRRQLVVSYGATAFLTIFAVVLMATIAALSAGRGVKSETRSLFTDQLIEGLHESGILTARIFSKKFNNLRTSSSLLTEIVRDRVVGYPAEFADDRHVPFVDMETGTRQYPLKAKLLPRDWQVQSNWRLDNLEEHTQERAELFKAFVGFMSTESAFFSFQGNCNPEDTVPSLPGYFPFCTDDNNNATLGGAVNPTPTLAALEQKAADIGVFLKPIWEAEPSAMQASVFFHNSGAGASVVLPSFQVDAARFYVSSGCDWMRHMNSYTNKPLGTEEEIARCSAAGTQVPIRLYNPMEREFCADQALHPGETRIYGPFLDAVWGQWRLSIGEAAFDRKTGEFIACTSIDLNLELTTALLDSISYSNRTNLIITRIDGTVVTGSEIDFSQRKETFGILDTDFIDEDTITKLNRNVRFWEGLWDPKEVQEGLLDSIGDTKGKLYSVFLAPPPPDTYDPNYIPDFLVYVSVHIEDVFGVVEDIEDEIDNSVQEVITISVVLGTVGLFCLAVFVWIVAQVLTRPLEWMESTAWKIVNHADKRVGANLTVVQEEGNDTLNPLVKCIPKTEVTDLVSEFQSMISGFSGHGASRVASSRVTELVNDVTWKEEFRELYTHQPPLECAGQDATKMRLSASRRISMRRDSLTKLDPDMLAKLAAFEEQADFRSEELVLANDILEVSGAPAAKLPSPYVSRPSLEALASEPNVRPQMRLNLGSNLPLFDEQHQSDTNEGRARISRSPLFWCILCWIVCPILLTIIAISTIVAWRLYNVSPAWVNSAKDTSFDLEFDKLSSSCALRALYSEQVVPGPLRDLHVATRLAGWLLFGAVSRSSSFTEIEIKMVEDCKVYALDEVCPFENDELRSPCHCKWNDPWDRTCTDIPGDSRDIQRMWYMNQNRDYDPDTGRRNESLSFPELDYSPSTTSWFTSVDDMPGADRGTEASGYGTTYDRIRVTSALSTAVFPIYNRVVNERVRRPHTAMSTYMSFESDGAYLGYAGCNYDIARYASFESSEDNQAYLINEDLCPKGKFGYDPRCRAWYSDAKQKALNSGNGVHITPPYQFATVTHVGTTAVSPLMDPVSGEFVGVTSVNFDTSEIQQILDDAAVDVFAVTMPNEPASANTVASSNMESGSTPQALLNVLLLNDSPGASNREDLVAVMSRMHEGKTGTATMKRTKGGGIEEVVHVVYSPVYTRELKSIQPNDYTRGTNASTALLYSIILLAKEDRLFARFSTIYDDIQRDLEQTSIVYLVVTGIVTAICVLVTARISVTVTKPMILLLEVVKRVNDGRIEDDMPPLSGGSREVHRVYSSFAKLYKIVRTSNSSFFSGDFILAHHIANDALHLFRKIGDRKAVAIACNNMGNTLLALMVERREPGTCLKLDGCCCAKAALNHFDEAVARGTEEFNGAKSDEEKTEFAQQLADRHFNRAMCLLHAGDDPCVRDDSKEIAFSDLHLAYQYDAGVKEYMLHAKTLLMNSDVIFDRYLRRLHGLATLSRMDDDVWQVWDVYESVDQADLMLQAAWNEGSAPLFKDVSKLGRLQELEGAVLGVEMSSGNLKDAAILATRMLVEDEYIIDSAFVEAADCLLRYTRVPGEANAWSDKSITSLIHEFKKMRKSGKNTAIDIGRSFVFCVEIDSRRHEASVLGELRDECLAFYDKNTVGTDSIGLASFGVNEMGIVLTPNTKGDMEAAQKEAIAAAAAGVASPKSDSMLPVAIKMILDVASSTANDAYLIYISDGSSWTADLSYESLREKIWHANAQRNASIDVIAIGLDVEDAAFEESCRDLCLATRSRNSTYIAASGDKTPSLEEAFERATSVVNCASPFDLGRLKHGLTMEKF